MRARSASVERSFIIFIAFFLVTHAICGSPIGSQVNNTRQTSEFRDLMSGNDVRINPPRLGGQI
jgi:hypothetical protein